MDQSEMPHGVKSRLRRRLLPISVAAILVGLVGATTTVAIAQQSAGKPDMPGKHWMMGPGRHHDGFAGGGFCRDLEARRAGLLAFAAVKLGITPDQQATWDNFANEVKNSEAPIRDVCAHLAKESPPQALPDRLARREEISEARLQQLRLLQPAVAKMYASLTPTQREMVDHFGPMGGPHGGPGGWGGPDGHRPDGPPPDAP